MIDTTLQNGIRVIGEKLETYRSATVGIWVKAGSVTETPEQNGMSHFIEHMMFKGTPTRSAKQIAVDMDRIGAQMNAFTSKECTCYYAKCVKERLPQAIEILGDMFCHSSFDPDEMEKEKGVVCEEIAMSNDNPEDLAHETLSQTFFEGCQLSQTILGPAENIRGLTREKLLDYKDSLYQPENTIVAIAGNFDEKELIKNLEEHLCDFSKKECQAPSFAHSFSPKRSYRYIERDIEQVHICLSFPGFAFEDDRKYALTLLNNVLGGSMSSRLFQRIREEKGMAYSVYAYPSVYTMAGMFSVYAGTSSANAAQVLEMIFEELDKIKKSGITDLEFEYAKEQMRGSYILALESTSARMNSLGKNKVLTGKVSSEEEILAKLERVSKADISQITEEILDTEKMTGTFVGKLPDESQIKRYFD